MQSRQKLKAQADRTAMIINKKHTTNLINITGSKILTNVMFNRPSIRNNVIDPITLETSRKEICLLTNSTNTEIFLRADTKM